MSRWFRAYDDALDDEKLNFLSDKSFRGWFKILCVASKNDGILPPIDRLAFRLRLSVEKTSELLNELYAAQLIDEVELSDAPMTYTPRNWKKRQYKSDVSTERVKRFRNVSGNAAKPVSETPPETETDTDTEADKKEALPSVALPAREPKPKAKNRAGPIPDGWMPSVKHYLLAEQFGQNVQTVEGIFRDYLASSGKLYANYDAAFNNFIRNQSNFNRGSSNGTAKSKSGGSLIETLNRAIERSEQEDRHAQVLEIPFLSVPTGSIRGPGRVFSERQDGAGSIPDGDGGICDGPANRNTA